ncbi:MAG: chlorophyll synthase ChlG [Paracoccaceae bacterium]|nr:chlorophyll synthase ChlG [Paracoccaceae bacterium]
MNSLQKIQNHSYPDISTSLELIKPITWFPPMWAFLCGAVSTGAITIDNLPLIGLGIFLAGPIVCGMSQAANDWCDRHVDAINEPNRPIPSGRMPGKWGLWIAILMSITSLFIGWFLGTWGFIATLIGVVCAWAYSAEPVRLKKSGVWGPFLVGICYEGLPWFTGAAVLSLGLPSIETIVLAFLYALGAFGIMTLNDFKAMNGDRETGINSLPVVAGEYLAARIACTVIAIPQIIVIILLLYWNLPVYGSMIVTSLILQFLAMRRFLKDPVGLAPWYNATGVMLYIVGMMISAIAISESLI